MVSGGDPRTAVGGGPTAGLRPERVLVVDDEDAVRRAFARVLARAGYAVTEAASAAAALETLDAAAGDAGGAPFALALVDVRMPGGSGLDLAAEVARRYPDVAVIMLTGMNDAEAATRALTTGGAMDYLLKPIEPAALTGAVRDALRRRSLLREQRRVEELIRDEVAVRTEELERERRALRDMTVGVAESLIAAMEAKDVYLRGHSQRVSALAASVAEELGLGADEVEHVRLAGRLADVGLIGVREGVLHKPGALTPAEFEHVKSHVAIGVEILSPLRHIGETITYVRHHHEHVDGSGYPAGLVGEAISLGGRILAAGSAFDALTSPRPYQRTLGRDEAIALLGSERGRRLDPVVYGALRRVVERPGALVFLDINHADPRPKADA
jgi:putative two-component system response regulator